MERERQQLAEWAKGYEAALSRIATETLSSKGHEVAVLSELGNITRPLLTVIPPNDQKYTAAMRVYRSSIVPYVIWFFEDEYKGFISSMVIGSLLKCGEDSQVDARTRNMGLLVPHRYH